jgi:hypothetical protein
MNQINDYVFSALCTKYITQANHGMNASICLNDLSPKLLYRFRLAHLEGYGSFRYLDDYSQFVNFASQGSNNFQTLQLKLCIQRPICIETQMPGG